MATPLLFSLTLLLLLPLSSTVPSETLLSAADILSTSGYLSMSLTLQVVSNSILPHSPSLTIFSPSDSAFARFGQPSLSLLLYHFSPISFPLRSLKSLSHRSKIPTLFGNQYLVVTSVNDTVAINGVNVSSSPLFDDGSLVILGIDDFFSTDFEVSGKHIGCSSSTAALRHGTEGSVFKDASEILRSKGYYAMAAFLDLQLLGFKRPDVFTIFAPTDDEIIGNLSDYSFIFLRHILPCRISGKELSEFNNDGVVLETYLDGFEITVTRSDDILMVNQVPVSLPNLYENGWIAVHGLRGVLKGAD